MSLSQGLSQEPYLPDLMDMPHRAGHTFIRISVISILATGIAGLFAPMLARNFLGIEDLVPVPTFELHPATLFQFGPLRVTNTILSSWMVTLLLVLILGLALGPAGRRFPRIRMAVELILEYLLDLFHRVAGDRWSTLTFTFIVTLFVFVVANAWITLLPIYGPVLFYPEGQAGKAVHLLRGAGTDINMPLALAIIAGIFVEIHTLRIQGVAYFREIFPIQNLLWRPSLGGLGQLYLALIHDMSRVTRFFSFSFRLFGAMTAGELLRIVVTFLTPLMLVVPFYGLEILLGLLQAVVFAGLTLVMMTIAEHEGGDRSTGDPQSCGKR